MGVEDSTVILFYKWVLKLGHSIKKATEEVRHIEIFPRKIKTLNDRYIIMAACGNKYSCAISN